MTDYQVTLPVAALKAASIAAAKTDVRYYLNAVMVERTSSGKVLVVATDRHILTAQVVEQESEEHAEGAPFQCLLPLDAVKALPKGETDVTLAYQPATTETPPSYALHSTKGTLAGAVVDGRFPDWRRIVPREASGEPGQFDADLLHRLQKAARTALSDRNALLDLHHNGPTGTALVSVGEANHWLGVVIPLRVKHEPVPAAILAEAIAD